MESTALINIFVIGFSLFTACRANVGFDIKYKWKTIDFNYPTNERQMAIQNGSFIPDNVIPVGIDVHNDRLFLSLPRLKHGVPASLAYINMNGRQKLYSNQYYELISRAWNCSFVVSMLDIENSN